MIQENNMGRFVCSSDDKEAWELPPGEASKQTFETKEEAIKWFENEYQGKEITLGGYRDTNYIVHTVKVDGKIIGQIDEYPNFK
ncbi:MAG: hypothetical protein AAFW70_01035 [Cyanobacteria bacterium J06635_10]